MRVIKIKLLTDKDGNNIAPITPEAAVYDNNGIRLSDKLLAITNPADEEDITQLQEDNKKVLKLKDRIYNPSNFSGKGYKILRKGKNNILTLEMLDSPNTIYEIRYDFNLNNKQIIIPLNCTLEFKGGSLSNFTLLIGNNTKIEGEALFKFNIETGYIGGTWKINKWESEWFGAIPDGTYPSQSEAEEIYIFTGTDNYNSIQGMLNAAIRTNINICHLKAGFYRVTKPLNMGYCDKAYYTCKLEGDNSYNGINYGHRTGEFGTILLVDHDYYGISINAGKGSSIEGIILLGKNYRHMLKKGSIVKSSDNNDINYLDINSYIGELMKLIKDNGISRYAPYAGIITDGTNWTDSSEPSITDDLYRYPTFPNAIWDGIRKSGASSRTVIKNCIISGFGVGIGLGLNNWWGNNEFTIIENCQITENIYGLVQGNGDGRHTAINNTLINTSYIGVDTVTFGTLTGLLMGLFQNCNFDALANIFNIYRPQDIKMLNCYAESTIRFGKIHYVYNRLSNMIIRDSTFMLKPVVNDATPIPDYYIEGDNILFDNVNINLFKNLFVIKGSGNNLQIRNSKLYATAIDSKATPLVITGTRAYEYNPKLIDSSVLDMYVSGNVQSYRNNHLYITDNFIGNIKKVITKTLGWSGVTDSFDNSLGELTLVIPQSLNSPEGKIYNSDLITNNKTGIVFIIKSIEKDDSNYIIKAEILNGYKIVNGIYELSDNYKGDYFIIQCTRQVPLSNTIYITNVEENVLTLNTWNDILEEGVIIDSNYDNTLLFTIPLNAVIKSINKELKKITLNGNILNNAPLNIKGVIVKDNLFYTYLNL